MKKIKVATRGSKLALKQVEIVTKNLRNHFEIEIIEILTSGDKYLTKPVYEIGGKGLFIKEIEECLINGKAHIAVHSLKDMETELAFKTFIGAVYERGSKNDILISDYSSLHELPKGAIIGTSSPRRTAFLKNLRKDFCIDLCRGNIETRISKFKNKQYDAIILAEAGLSRLNLDYGNKIPLDIIPPAAGQGAIAIQCIKNSNNMEINQAISMINNEKAFFETEAERSLIHNLNGNCRSPISSSANLINSETLVLEGHVAKIDGSSVIFDKISGNKNEANILGLKLAKRLIKKGAKKLL